MKDMIKEGRQPLNEMATIGKFGQYNVVVHSNEGNIPRFHVVSSNGFKSCIRVDSAEYFSHGCHNDVLRLGERKALVKLLQAERRKGMTNWEVLLMMWNNQNPENQVDENQQMPDYIHMGSNDNKMVVHETINKSELKEIINETVSDVLNRIGMINEMAASLKEYKQRVDGLRFQIVENWCLCKWCQLFNPKCENFTHWVTELKTCINNLKFLDIKNDIDKRRTLMKMLVADYDYDDAKMIERIIRGKFVRENISDNSQKIQVCMKFADNIQGLIDAISSEAIDTDEYIYNAFTNK